MSYLTTNRKQENAKKTKNGQKLHQIALVSILQTEGVITRILLSNTKNAKLLICILLSAEIQCPDISNETIKDGSILSTHRLVDSIAVYECTKGYRIVGDKARVCQLNGTLSGNHPVCQGTVHYT